MTGIALRLRKLMDSLYAIRDIHVRSDDFSASYFRSVSVSVILLIYTQKTKETLQRIEKRSWKS